MSKKKIRLFISIILVAVSLLYTVYCVIYSDSRLFLAIISVFGTGSILLKEINTK